MHIIIPVCIGMVLFWLLDSFRVSSLFATKHTYYCKVVAETFPSLGFENNEIVYEIQLEATSFLDAHTLVLSSFNIHVEKPSLFKIISIEIDLG